MTISETEKLEPCRTAAQSEREAVLPPFTEAWAKKEAAGYRYGGDALENVEFGYEIAREELAALTTPSPSVSREEIVAVLEPFADVLDDDNPDYKDDASVRYFPLKVEALRRARSFLHRLQGEG